MTCLFNTFIVYCIFTRVYFFNTVAVIHDVIVSEHDNQKIITRKVVHEPDLFLIKQINKGEWVCLIINLLHIIYYLNTTKKYMLYKRKNYTNKQRKYARKAYLNKS